MRGRLLLPILLAGGCYRQREVPRPDWPALNDNQKLSVRTTSGQERSFNRYVFTTAGLSAWRVGSDTNVRVDSALISFDSIAVVRVTEFDRAATMLATASATTVAFIVLSLGESGNRPPAVPRPPAVSCPFVYSFDGKDYRLDSETYAGAVARALERTDVDNLEHLRAVDGRYRLRVRNERPETEYTDELMLIAADHAPHTRALPDAGGTVHVVGETRSPVRASTYGGDSIPSRAGEELVFARPRGDSLALVLRVRNTSLAPFVIGQVLDLLGSGVYAWYSTLRAQPMTRTIVQSWIAREGALDVRLMRDGAWQSVARIPDVGPVIAKTHVVVLPAAALQGDSVVVRLESSPGLWTIEESGLAPYVGRATTQTLAPSRAVDENGRDVTALLTQRDGRYLVATRGSDVRVEYAAPDAPKGMTRSILLRTTGHYYINTSDSTPPRPEIVQRLLTDRAFAQQYFADAWVRAGNAPLIPAR